MSRSQFYSIKLFILRHAWLNLWDKHMTTGRINQVTLLSVVPHSYQLIASKQIGNHATQLTHWQPTLTEGCWRVKIDKSQKVRDRCLKGKPWLLNSFNLTQHVWRKSYAYLTNEGQETSFRTFMLNASPHQQKLSSKRKRRAVPINIVLAIVFVLMSTHRVIIQTATILGHG